MEFAKIVNHEKFKETIRNLGNNKDIAKKLKVNPSCVSNWISGKRKPTSSNILKILKIYENQIAPEQLGVKIYSTVTNETFDSRLTELLNEYNINGKEFSEEIGYSEATVSMWKKGKIPSNKTIKDIASYFDVSTLYMLGETNIKNADNDDVSKILQCSEHFLELIKNDLPTAKRVFMGIETTAEELEEKYYDLKDNIFGDVALLSTLKAECDRVVHYYLGYGYYDRFESTINQVEIMSQTTENPNRIENEEIAHLSISKALIKAFDKYTNRKVIEMYKNDERFKKMYTDNEDEEMVTATIKRNIGNPKFGKKSLL